MHILCLELVLIPLFPVLSWPSVIFGLPTVSDPGKVGIPA